MGGEDRGLLERLRGALAGRYTIEHELGHVHGYGHKDSGVMDETLKAGEWHNPEEDSTAGLTVLDAVLADLADDRRKDRFNAP